MKGKLRYISYQTIIEFVNMCIMYSSSVFLWCIHNDLIHNQSKIVPSSNLQLLAFWVDNFGGIKIGNFLKGEWCHVIFFYITSVFWIINVVIIIHRLTENAASVGTRRCHTQLDKPDRLTKDRLSSLLV